MDKYLLIIEKGVNLGSFTYKIKGEDYYHNTKTLNELVHEIKDIDIKYLEETPVYSNIEKEDKQILEGLRRKILVDDIEKFMSDDYQI